MNKIPSNSIYFYCRCFTSELCIIDWSGGFCICSTFTALFMCDGMNMGLYFLSLMNYSPLCKDSLQQVVMFHIRSHHIDVCVQHVRETDYLLLWSPRPHLVPLQKKLWNIVTAFLKCVLCEYLFKCNFKSLSQTFSLTVPIWWNDLNSIWAAESYRSSRNGISSIFIWPSNSSTLYSNSIWSICLLFFKKHTLDPLSIAYLFCNY